ncbi:hypothetical protein E6W39_10745 [Kitasatospora acidiphila]|uniref:Uncharacterized protein n=1 Tax=Kitasatospora acidiphila TaxID=2567942 RepID=A0A540W0X8_9ACTN|nr:hypothetical protein [Kitasatospora acidiphila]TQF02652.1 hypothetical protein E6W39_10745 [Kitasatospora acidiphila]
MSSNATPNTPDSDSREGSRFIRARVRKFIQDLMKLDMHSKNPVDRDAAYTCSYRNIRLSVGAIGVLLPLAFIFGELATDGRIGLEGSISAYYHSSVQDMFVGALCIIGFMLVTYMSGEPKVLDFWVSLVGGIALLMVVIFPTNRSHKQFLDDPRPCGSSPRPLGCSALEQIFHEHPVAKVHALSAIIFILCLAIMSALFAISELIEDGQGDPGKVPIYRPGLLWLHLACALLIVAAGAWALFGGLLKANIGQVTPLYLGEVVSVFAFGISWGFAGLAATAPPRQPVQPPVTS